jgi:hypothetical protein
MEDHPEIAYKMGFINGTSIIGGGKFMIHGQAIHQTW